MLLRIFDEDLKVKVYGERSRLTSQDTLRNIRLNSLESVKSVIAEDRAPLIILKPLVETQNILQLLDNFENAKSFMIFRDYKDVAHSNLIKFGIGNGIRSLKAIVENAPENWRSEWVPEHVRRIVLAHFSEDMNPFDAAVLFWYVRNSLFFDRHLDESPHVRILKYEHFVKDPLSTMQYMYDFVGQNFPGEKIIKGVSASSVGKGAHLQLSQKVDHVCQALMGRLDDVYESQMKLG